MAEAVETRSAHPVVSALADAFAGVRDAADSAIYTLGGGELAKMIGECEGLRAVTHHLELALVREADGRNLPRQLGAASTAAWLTGRYRLQPKDARRLVRVAAVIGEVAEPTDYAANVGTRRTGRELVDTAAALAEGVISPEHVSVVAGVLDRVPSELGVEATASAEHEMAGFCRRFDPGTVAKMGEALVEALTEDTLDNDEGERHRRRYLSLDEATGRLRGQLTREQIATLRTALDALAAPAPAQDGTPDQRTAGQRMADALEELARRAVAADMFEKNHGMSHRVVVTIEIGALAGGHEHEDDGLDVGVRADTSNGGERTAADNPADGSGADGSGPAWSATEGESTPGVDEGVAGGSGAAGLGTPGCVIPARGPARPGELQWGGLISAHAARLIACHASIQRVVLNPAGAVLDVGREYRTVTPAQFAALIARDGGCAFPGCTRPSAWCIAHHIRHWIDGGETNLDNLVLLCGHHHRVVHYNSWDVRIDPADRLPVFTPPRWMHADRVDWRNSRPRPGRAHRLGRAVGTARRVGEPVPAPDP